MGRLQRDRGDKPDAYIAELERLHGTDAIWIRPPSEPTGADENSSEAGLAKPDLNEVIDLVDDSDEEYAR